MVKNLTQSSPYEDEIDLLEIFKILVESKKLIISSILIFTIASIIYSLSLKPSFESSTKLEIGYFTTNNVDRELIESPSDLISDLNILLMKNPDGKFSQNVSMSSFENKIINLVTTSGSVEQNENLLTEIISYIDERHSNLALLSTGQKKEELSLEIKLIESEISFIEESMQFNLEGKIFDLEGRILKLENDLPILEQEIGQLEQVVIYDLNNLNLLKETTLFVQRAANSPTLEQIISNYKSKINGLKRERNISISDITVLSKKLDTLKKDTLQSDELFKLEQALKNTENELQLLMTQTQIITRPISNIETKTIKPKTQLTIFLGLIIGFITGIFLVFIRNFVRSYKESET
jgi:LPS O-antigen subunit length determinant protein (WzzB/FepE family)